MAKPTTHVLMVVDRSGSMHLLASDVRGGFNAYVKDLRADADARYRLTAVLFNNDYETLCVAAKLKDVPTLDEQQAGGLGFDRGNTVVVAATPAGTRSSYAGLSKATRSHARGATAADTSGAIADAVGDPHA